MTLPRATRVINTHLPTSEKGRIGKNHSLRMINTKKKISYPLKRFIQLFSLCYLFFGAPYWFDRRRRVPWVLIRGGSFYRIRRSQSGSLNAQHLPSRKPDLIRHHPQETESSRNNFHSWVCRVQGAAHTMGVTRDLWSSGLPSVARDIGALMASMIPYCNTPSLNFHISLN